jgi:capsid protein
MKRMTWFFSTTPGWVRTRASARLAKVEKFLEHGWRGRRWDWVDPRADTTANVEAVNNRLKSRTRVMEEEGEDIEEVFAELAAETELAKEYGIALPSLPAQKNDAPAVPPDQNQPAT